MSDTAQILTRALDASSPTRVRDYVDLLKPRVMSLVVFTGLVGVLIAPGHIHPFAAALAVLAIALGSGAAGAINMWYERDLDALMTRTRNRPLPAGRVAPDDALGLGVLFLSAQPASQNAATPHDSYRSSPADEHVRGLSLKGALSRAAAL